MEKAKEFLTPTSEEADRVSKLTFPPHRRHSEPSFYEYFILRGIRVDRVERDSFFCSFKVPGRLTDSDGNLSMAAIVSLVDQLGSAVIHESGMPISVTIDMSIAYVSAAKMSDELEIVSSRLGQHGQYNGTNVIIRNKRTGEIVADGRLSMFNKRPSKL